MVHGLRYIGATNNPIPNADVTTPIENCSPVCTRVSFFAVMPRGTEITSENTNIPRIDPSPKMAMYANPVLMEST